MQKMGLCSKQVWGAQEAQEINEMEAVISSWCGSRESYCARIEDPHMQPYSYSQHIRATQEVFPWEQDDSGGKLRTRGGREILCSLVCELLREKYSIERTDSLLLLASLHGAVRTRVACSVAQL